MELADLPDTVDLLAPEGDEVVATLELDSLTKWFILEKMRRDHQSLGTTIMRVLSKAIRRHGREGS